MNYTSGVTPEGPQKVAVKIRYKASQSSATVVAREGQSAEVLFESPQRAVTPGQAVVFYTEEELVGGGYIELSPPSLN